METIENQDEEFMKMNHINPEDYNRREKEVDRAWYEADEDMTAGNNDLFESYAEQEVQEQEE